MHSTKLLSISSRFALRSNVIEGIIEAIQGDGGTASISVSCTEGLTLKPSSSKELLGIPNHGESKITGLEISSNGANNQVSVKFSALGFADPISVYVSGEADDVIRLSAKLKGLVSQAKDGWWPKSVGLIVEERFYLLPVSMFASLLAIWAEFRLGLAGHSFGYFLAMGILFWAVIGFVMATITWALAEKVYVRGVFLIGAGEQEYETLKFRRQQLSIWTVVAGLISAFAFALIGHWLHF